MTCDVADEETDFAGRAHFIMIFAYWVAMWASLFLRHPSILIVRD